MSRSQQHRPQGRSHRGRAHNQKYKGVYVWNASYQSEHPKTGQLIKLDKPAHEVIRLDRPEIRIVPDDLWEAVAVRLAKMRNKQVQREQGGYNRATDQAYLYSGFLFCGECGGKLIANGILGKDTTSARTLACTEAAPTA